VNHSLLRRVVAGGRSHVHYSRLQGDVISRKRLVLNDGHVANVVRWLLRPSQCLDELLVSSLISIHLHRFIVMKLLLLISMTYFVFSECIVALIVISSKHRSGGK
jgi:hypothetical protein